MPLVWPNCTSLALDSLQRANLDAEAINESLSDSGLRCTSLLRRDGILT